MVPSGSARYKFSIIAEDGELTLSPFVEEKKEKKRERQKSNE